MNEFIKRKLIILILFCFSSLYAVVLPEYEVRPHVSGITFEQGHVLKDGHVYGFDFAKGINDKFMISLSLNMNTIDYNGNGSGTDFYMGMLNGEYYYYEKGNFQSYLTAGFSHIDVENTSNMSGFNYGIGAKYLINDDAGLYAEARHLTTFEKNENQLVYTFGVIIPFGYEAQKQPLAPDLEPLAIKEVPQEEAPLLPSDDDRDGVVNDRDKCPDSDLSYEVDEEGCTIRYTLHVKFAFDSSELTKDSMQIIKDFSVFMDEPERLNIEIQGHTDTLGSHEYNEQLSLRRARSVYNALIDFGISKDRMKYVGYGETQLLVAEDNKEENYAQNRRVQILILKSE